MKRRKVVKKEKKTKEKKLKQRYIHDIREIKDETDLEFVVNDIYISLELIGLYKLHNGDDEQFHSFYEKETKKTKYYYRNLGINIIYDLLLQEGTIDKLKYNLSKRSMRRTGICFTTMRAYEGTDIFVKRIMKYFKDNAFLGEFYINHLHHENIELYLDFQHKLINNHHYKGYIGGDTKYFGNMEKKIEEAIIINGQ